MWIYSKSSLRLYCNLTKNVCAFGKPADKCFTLVTHTSSFLLKFCSFLSVRYSPLHKAHWLVHVAFNPVNHSTLTQGTVSKLMKSNKWRNGFQKYVGAKSERGKRNVTIMQDLHQVYRSVTGTHTVWFKCVKLFKKSIFVWKMGRKQEEVTSKLVHQLAEVQYLACFGLVPYSFFGLFLSLHYVVHWLRYILLYVVYNITLEHTKYKQ